jgi:putative SOS response-associated peptidase YedK
MCGRFTLTARDIDAAARAFGAEVEREHARLYRPRWNIAPTDPHWIVRLDGAGRRRLVPARFGLDGQGGGLLINARSETAASLPTFRRACADGRCIVPADGFYEWRGARSARQPLWFHDPGGKPLLLAGLATPRDGGLAFVILTTAANERMRPVHDRMPALLSPDAAEAWLARGDMALLAPAPPASLSMREVSPRVNAVSNDGPELLDALEPPRQLTLL